jgi:hypothetical protein
VVDKERTIQTGLGDIDVQVPKIRDKSKQGIKFNSLLIPPYLFKRLIVPADSPLAFAPNKDFNASEKSPVEIPFRYKTGNNSSIHSAKVGNWRWCSRLLECH